MKKSVLAVFFGLVLLSYVGLALAGFELGEPDYSIASVYAPGSTLTGWINLSLDSESTGILFKDNQGNSIPLMDLLSKNNLYVHNCTPVDCGITYETKNSGEEKSFSLVADETKTFAAKIDGNINKILNFGFSLESDAAASCNSQVKIDLLSDGEIDFQNNKASGAVCENSKNYGCFSNTSETEYYTLSSTPYCQKIEFNEAPAYRAGAWVKRSNDAVAQLTVFLYDSTRKVSQCSLPGTSGEGEVFCDLEYLIKETKDYYVCVFANNSISYKIRGYSDGTNNCGFYGIPSAQKTEISAYSIFAEPKKFDAVRTLEISNKIDDKTNASKLIEDYIKEKYGSLNCPSSGCVIPFTIESTLNQSLTIKELILRYEKASSEVTNEKIYDADKKYAKVDAEYQKFYLDEGNFTLPNEYKNFTYRLDLDGDEIIEEDFTIGGGIPVVEGLSPRVVALGFPTKFMAEITGDATKFEWKFDGVAKSTTKNSVEYTFETLGKHNVSVGVKDSRNRGSNKIFEVNVTTPEAKIEDEINQIQSRIENIKTSISEFNAFEQDSIKNALNLEENENKLKEVQLEYESATDQEDYVSVIEKLLEINVPEQIFVSETADGIIFFPQEETISQSTIEDISGEEYNGSGKFSDAILGWQQKNVEMKISYDAITGFSDGSNEPITRIFDLEIIQKTQNNKDFYLVLEKIEGLKFKENYGQKNISGHYYIPYSGEGHIVFSTTENINFANLPAFISPNPDELPKSLVGPVDDGGISKWVFFTLAIIFLLIIGFVIYAILHQWYKNKYENHLFKNRNNLFNLVNYINNQKRKGIEEKDIISKLKKAKWNSEQIDYAIRKYCGKRTGMFEIPFVNLFNKKQKEAENRRFGFRPRRGF